jgi:glycosyltransferase involved in cell wall biosynthesis
MTKKRLLIIGMVWPEPTSSAAGTRMIQLIELFSTQHYEMCFASAASKSEFSYNLPALGVKERSIKLNDPDFNAFVKSFNPDMVLFDRYMIEEQYGWRVQQECPDALRILDTEDLHFLRHARQQGIKKEKLLSPSDLLTDIAKREIAAILRSDLSLIISEVEMKILTGQFKIDSSLIYYLPFLEDELDIDTINQWKTFEQRAGFVFIGNFLHDPNWHTLQVLKNQIWPSLRKKIPGVTLDIFGAYPSQKVLQLNNIKERFIIKGRTIDALETISKHRVLLAPIQFGAGLKGKFIDAMRAGTPCITTQTGAEAMKGDLNWNGFVEDDQEIFIKHAVQLYHDKAIWLKAQQNGIKIINERYNKLKLIPLFLDVIHNISLTLKAHRQKNFVGQILLHHTANSTKYMSLWIEEKNSK